eukprot:GHUV01005744.1.p1 GENE.GHUV01005744.1~~GHUV01005744.1.p1  ORF type:complete len:210 (+),score=12.84 GHUV01005744.1:182-811(+)
MHTQRIQAGRAPHAGFCKGLAPSQRHLATPHAAHPDSSSVPESVPPHIYLGDGDAIFLPKPRTEAGPSFEYDKEQAVEVQLQALRVNEHPRYDHGIEVLYRFANFDPFQRSRYFGKSFDLGQFERFRRIMHIPAYKPLLNHEQVTTLSTLKVSERCWKTRVHVIGAYGRDEGVFEFTMVQRLGGRYDGWWFTESLIADGVDWKSSIISY